MHYKDGTEAKVGDVAKGVPYNQGGKVVVGTVTQLTAGTNSCNLQLLFVVKEETPIFGHSAAFRAPTGVVDPQTWEPMPLVDYKIGHDYGACHDFELVHRALEPVAVAEAA